MGRELQFVNFDKKDWQKLGYKKILLGKSDTETRRLFENTIIEATFVCELEKWLDKKDFLDDTEEKVRKEILESVYRVWTYQDILYCKYVGEELITCIKFEHNIRSPKPTSGRYIILKHKHLYHPTDLDIEELENKEWMYFYILKDDIKTYVKAMSTKESSSIFENFGFDLTKDKMKSFDPQKDIKELKDEIKILNKDLNKLLKII